MAQKRPQKPADEDDSLLERVREVRHDALTTAGAGIAFSLLFLAGLWLLFRIPGAGQPDAEISAFYASDHASWVRIAGLYVLPLSAVAFLWFIALLRSWMRFRTDRLSGVFSTVQLISGVAFVTLTLAGAGAGSVIAMGVDLTGTVLVPDVARAFPIFGRVLMGVFAMRMAAIFVTATATLGVSASLFPKWFRLLSSGVAIALFVANTLNPALLALFPLWVLGLCGLIVRGSRMLAETDGLRAHRFEA